MRALIIFCFIFSLPLAAVLAHDAYIFYETRQEDPGAPFQFSDTGFIWYTYSKETHNQVAREIGPESWNDNVKPALRIPAVFYAGGIAGISYIAAFLIWMFAIWPANRVRKVKEGKSAFSSHVHGKKTFKYNRK